MSATLFLALCILGCDFLLYFLFQWTYGEKRRGLSRKSRAPMSPMNQPDARPFLVASRKSAAGGVQRLQTTRRRTTNDDVSDLGHLTEARAYRRIAASFGQAKR
jgi:hypothetical protein